MDVSVTGAGNPDTVAQPDFSYFGLRSDMATSKCQTSRAETRDRRMAAAVNHLRRGLTGGRNRVA